MIYGRAKSDKNSTANPEGSLDLKYVTPDLRRLDLFVGEVLVVPIATDERPPRGAAGLFA